MQRHQTQTPARRAVSTRRTRRTIQRQTESMDINPGCSNTQPNNPSCQIQTNNNPASQPNKRQKRNPIHFMEVTVNPTASLPNFPEPLQPGETAVTKLWHYKHNNAALLGNVKACNTNFRYDYQIQEVLDWQQISKPNVTPTLLHRRNTKSTTCYY